jgi:hypothetical protein
MTQQLQYGIIAEFLTPEALVRAVRRAHEKGFRDMETYTPMPVEGVEEILERPNWLPLFVLGGGVTGTLTGFALQEYIAVWNYPINVGGRPLNSWPSFVVVSFELTILFASLAAFFFTLFFSGLPRPYHPLANNERFAFASTEHFFLYISASDRHYNPERTAEFLRELDPEYVELVDG